MSAKKNLLGHLILFLLLYSSFAASREKRIVRVPLADARQLEQLQRDHFDLATGFRDGHVDVVVDDQAAGRLQSLGFSFHASPVEAPFLSKADLDLTEMGRYHTYAEMTQELTRIAQDNPNITRLQVIGHSIENRNLYALKVSDHPDLDEDDEAGVLYIANIHARETVTPEIIFYFLNYLMDHYGVDERVTRIIDGRQLWLIPTINPDGHVEVEKGDAWWRKNRRINPDSSIGVDLNRNFGFKWGYDNLGSSPIYDNEIYRGQSVFSEPETQAIRDFVQQHRIIAAISYHSYGRLWLFPWQYYYGNTPDHELFMEMGRELTRYNEYKPGNCATGAIYLVNGGSDDYFYGEAAKGKRIFGFTAEVGNTFHHREASILRLVDENLQANLYMAEIAGLLMDQPIRALPPSAPVMSLSPIDDDGRFQVSWQPSTADGENAAIAYTLQELSGFAVVTDSAEQTCSWLESENFNRSSTRFASGAKSYYSATVQPIRSDLTWRFPFVVTPDQHLTFKAWYSLEPDFDFFYVQASRDQGETFISLKNDKTQEDNLYGRNNGNGITGFSNGWERMDFDLSAFSGEEIILRIRHFTEGDVTYGGLNLDDIGTFYLPQRDQILARWTAATRYSARRTQPGLLAFRVLARDRDEQESRWSPMKKVWVDFGKLADVNRDQTLDRLDVLRCADLVLQKGVAATCGEQWRANLDGTVVNDSSTVTVLDVVRLTRLLLQPAAMQKTALGRTGVSLGEASVRPGERVRVPVYLDGPTHLAGLQMQILDQRNALTIDSVLTGESSTTLYAAHQQNRVLLFDRENQPLPKSPAKLCDLLISIPHDFDPGIDSLAFGEFSLVASSEGTQVDSVRWQSGRLLSSFFTGVERLSQVPRPYGLEQNHPNPFNQSTTIPFTLREAGWVTLRLYDVTGREIRTLLSGHYEPGDHRFIWQALDLASGVYVYHLQVNEYSLWRKALILK